MLEIMKSDFRITLHGSLIKYKQEMKMIAPELVEHYLYFSKEFSPMDAYTQDLSIRRQRKREVPGMK
jgi:hypothetical protein